MIEEYNEKAFENIKHFDEFGNEYWEARELMPLLEYSKWENFHKVIKRAIIACETSNNNINDHFPEFRKMVDIGSKTKRETIDYHLSRYACYLIVQNANPRKKSVALGQTYFAIQTRKQEITELEYSKLSEDEKRLYTRILVNNKNKYLFKTAKESGVENFGKFNNFGYKGLYNGETAKQIAKRKNIKEKILLLTPYINEEILSNLIKNDITLTIDSVKGAGLVNEISKKLNKKVYAHIKIDTGLSRYGFDYKNYKEIINMIKENENIIFEGIYSHFSNSLASDNSFSNIQYERLINVIEKIEKEKITFKYKHICNSSGFFKYKDKHLNAARVGSAFSGCATGIKTDLNKIGLFHTKLTKVRNIKKGDYVGYANSYIAKKDMKIGILETGYYDGVGLELITQRFKFKSRLKNALLSLKSLIKGDNMTLNIDGKIINVIGQIGMHDVVIDITGLDYKEDDDIYFYYRPVYINENVKRVYK